MVFKFQSYTFYALDDECIYYVYLLRITECDFLYNNVIVGDLIIQLILMKCDH